MVTREKAVFLPEEVNPVALDIILKDNHMAPFKLLAKLEIIISISKWPLDSREELSFSVSPYCQLLIVQILLLRYGSFYVGGFTVYVVKLLETANSLERESRSGLCKGNGKKAQSEFWKTVQPQI